MGTGAAAGGTSGAMAGGNATGNNYLTHKQEAEFKKDLANCQGDPSCIEKETAKWRNIDEQQTADVNPVALVEPAQTWPMRPERATVILRLKSRPCVVACHRARVLHVTWPVLTATTPSMPMAGRRPYLLTRTSSDSLMRGWILG